MYIAALITTIKNYIPPVDITPPSLMNLNLVEEMTDSLPPAIMTINSIIEQ